jgi:glutamate 5-kinase
VLILLTSAPGLLRDMKKPEEGPIPVVTNVDDVIHHAEQEKSTLGTGGMISKLRAVQDAVHGGVECIIASGRHAEQIPSLLNGAGVCTRFPAKTAN